MIGVRFLSCLFVMFKGDCNAVIQVNIGRTFNGKFVVLRQQLTPFHFITVDRPAVTLKPAPENRFSVLISFLDAKIINQYSRSVI